MPHQLDFNQYRLACLNHMIIDYNQELKVANSILTLNGYLVHEYFEEHKTPASLVEALLAVGDGATTGGRTQELLQ